MKMLKKLLAVVLTGAMALTLLTACGSNAVNDKNIADALNDIVKSSVAAGLTKDYTFKPRTDDCLEGVNVAKDSLYFLAPALTNNHWIMENRTHVMTIGAHWFYR